MMTNQSKQSKDSRLKSFNGMVRLARSEEGGAYTLSYAMVVPILMFLVCIIIETTLMMSAKVGTVFAAYSGARAASVWSSAAPSWSEAEIRIKEAATQSFVPFASGTSISESGNDAAGVDAYVETYEQFASKPVSGKYVRAKYRNAANLLDVSIDGRPAEWDSEITVQVAYRFPFNVPGIGRLMGEPGDGGKYYYRLESQATLNNDAPQNANQDLGIGYGRFE